MKKTTLLFLLITVSVAFLKGQVIETVPGIPTKGQPITIYFNSDKLDPAASLYNYEGDLYAHTGVTIDGERWQNVIEDWGNNTTQPQLEYLGSYRYKLDITPDIENFYPDGDGMPISGAEVVSEICMVIRNAAATAQTSPDYFIEVFEAGLEVNITNPDKRSVIIEHGEIFSIDVSASLADSIVLYIDNIRIKKGATSELLTYSKYAGSYGGAWVKAVAYDMPETAVDSFYYYVPDLPVTETLPIGLEDGINYISDTEATLVLTAPGKSRAFVTGDFNSWIKGDASYMKVTPDGNKFWLELTSLTPGIEYRYQYDVDGILIADPYTEKVLDPWNDKYIDAETYPDPLEYPEGLGEGIVGVLQASAPQYEWQTSGYIRPEKNDLVIYELLLRDFLAAHNYETLIDTLPYLAKLGINAIELMPVNEFDDNESWGYNPSFYFAPDKYYGTKDKLKEFIDSCHARGIAVILDVVLNHATGSSPMAILYWDAANNKTAADNPWFNVDPTHDYNVFHDFNHDSEFTRYHAIRVMRHWIEEYRVDGYRFDLSKGFTQKYTVGNVGAWGQYDANRVALWKMYANNIWAVDSEFYVILEHFADNSEEKELAEYGMMLWSNLNGQYSEASKGFTSNISWGSYLTRGWSLPHNVLYMESHDEERMQYRNNNEGNSSGGYSVRYFRTGLSRIILSGTFFFTIPGPKMIWQFGELGYDFSIDLFGRTSPKPIRWDYFGVPERKTIYQSFAALIDLKTSEPAFRSDDFSIEEEGMMKRVSINHESMDVRVLGNFDVISGSLSGNFSKTGKWYEFFSGDSIDVTSTTELLSLEAGDYRLYTTKRFERPNLAVSINDLFEREYNNSWFNLYPNPVNDIVTIDIVEENIRAIDHINIISYDGRVVYSRTGQVDNVLDLSILDAGIYLFRIESGSRLGVKRIVKIK